MKSYSLILLLGLWMVSGCCKDCYDVCNPDCDNYNPCICTPKTSADFKMEIQAGNRWFEIDLISPGCPPYVRFTAIDSTADEYLWEIGAETFQTRSCVVGCFPRTTHVPIKLSVKRKKPNTSCHPDDKGFDSLTKYLYSADLSDKYVYNNNNDCSFQLPENRTDKTIRGKFRGYNKSNPSRTFEMQYNGYKAFCKTDYKQGILGLYSAWNIPTLDLINIPYEGNSVHKSFFVEGKHINLNTNGSQTVDGIKVADSKLAGDYQALQAGWYFDDYYMETKKLWDTVPLIKYYGFFKFYAYLDAKDKDKLTFEYWYRDTITRKIRNDVFIGTRVP